MKEIKKKYSAVEKLKVAAEAMVGHLTQNEITKRYGVHSTQISNWKKSLKHGAEAIFGLSKRQSQKENDKDCLIEDLYKEIGKLKYKLEWVKKNLSYSIDEKRQMIEQNNILLSIKQQCELLGISRAAYYYEPEPSLTLKPSNTL